MENNIAKIESKDSYGITYYEHGQAYLGSHRGMRFRLNRDPMEDVALTPADKKGEAVFSATIWPEPFCFEKTPDEQKTTKPFAFDMQGKEEMIAWLNEQYESRYEEWERVRAKH